MQLDAIRSGTLTRDESIVLVKLARALVRADGHISDPELDVILELARAVGLDVFADALDHAETHKPLGDRDLADLAARVGESKRELVLGTLYELGASDGLVEPEQKLLRALARHWSIEDPTVR